MVMIPHSGCLLVAMTLVLVSCSEPVPHDDHSPRHGGLVMMLGDLHYEVVLDPAGEHHVFFTDETRTELPPDIASEVTITINRREGPPETLPAEIDEAQTGWVAQGQPIDDIGTIGRIDFTLQGEDPYWIDLPFGFSSPS